MEGEGATEQFDTSHLTSFTELRYSNSGMGFSVQECHLLEV